MVAENVHFVHAVVRKVKEWSGAACVESKEGDILQAFLKDWLPEDWLEWWEKEENRYAVLMVLSLVVLLRLTYYTIQYCVKSKQAEGVKERESEVSHQQQRMSGRGERNEAQNGKVRQLVKAVEGKIFEETKEDEERRPSLTIKTKLKPKRTRTHRASWKNRVLDDEEKIIVKGSVKKYSGFTYRTRLLVLTNKRLFYMDPVTMQFRCDLELEAGTTIRLVNKKAFSLSTKAKSKKEIKIETSVAEDWVYAIKTALKDYK